MLCGEPESDPDEESRLFNFGGPSSELELGLEDCAGGFEGAGAFVAGADWLESDVVLPFVNRGGSSPELGFEGCEDVFEGGAPLADGAGLLAFGSRVSRGGPSSAALIPAGADSAFFAVSGASVPFARHTPVPSQGIAAFGLLLCSALPTVNSPSELPVRSPSYTLPESNAIGTGSAL